MTQDREPVGSVAEEAAKLFEALQDRAAEGGSRGVPGASGMLAGLGAILGELGTSSDGPSHGAECRSCPICRGIALFRGISSNPEVKHHLAMAADSLLHAVTEAMETRAPEDADSPERADEAHVDPADDAATS